MSNKYFPPYRSTSNDIRVELDLSNYATKDDVKNITHVDVSSYATKTNLAALKSKVELKNKVDAIDTSKFVSRTKFTTDTNTLDDEIDKVEKKIPDITGLAIKSSVTHLVTEQEDYTDKVKKRIPDISGLASKKELTAVENKIPDVVV